MKNNRSPLSTRSAKHGCGILLPRLFVLLLLLPTMVNPEGKASVAADPPRAKLPTTISCSIRDREVQDRLKLSGDQREKVTALDAAREAELGELAKSSTEEKRVSYSQRREADKRFESGRAGESGWARTLSAGGTTLGHSL